MTDTDHSGEPKPGDENQRPSLLLLCRAAPYGGALAREALEAALAGGAMGFSISLLFLDEGVWQLLDHQDSNMIHAKNHRAMLGALPLYEVDELFVDRASLTARRLSENDISPGIRVIDTTEVKQLLRAMTRILSF